MATKKDKRAAGEARAITQRTNSIESGLLAQKCDQEARQRQAMKAKLAADAMEKKLKRLKHSDSNRQKQNGMAHSGIAQ